MVDHCVQEQLQEEIRQITASCPPGTFGSMSGGHPALETHQYKGFVIAIHTFPRLNGLYSTLSGIRKAGAPLPQEPFPLSEAEFPTHEAALRQHLKNVWGRLTPALLARLFRSLLFYYPGRRYQPFA